MKHSKQTLGRHILILLLLGTGYSLLGLLVSKSWAVDFGFGVLISYLPYCYFVVQAFRISAAADAPRAFLAMMRGASGKFILTAALFAVLFTLRPDLSAPAVFSGFLIMLFTQIVASVFLEKKLTEQNQD